MDNTFEQQVIADLSSLKTGMEALIGNGQPGRVGKLESTVQDHDRSISRFVGGLILAGGLAGSALAVELFHILRH